MFLLILFPFGPIWTLLDHFRQTQGQRRVWRWCLWAKNHLLFEMVQKGPDGPKRVPNCQKHQGWPFRTLLDHFEPLWNVDKPAMFGHICLFYWCVFFGHIFHLANFSDWRCDKVVEVQPTAETFLLNLFRKPQKHRIEWVSFFSISIFNFWKYPELHKESFKSRWWM